MHKRKKNKNFFLASQIARGKIPPTENKKTDNIGPAHSGFFSRVNAFLSWISRRTHLSILHLFAVLIANLTALRHYHYSYCFLLLKSVTIYFFTYFHKAMRRLM